MINHFIKEKLATMRRKPDLSSGCRSSNSEAIGVDKDNPKSAEEKIPSKKIDAFNQWLCEFSHYAGLEQWTE